MKAKASDKVECRTPTPDKQPTRIDRWKFDAVRAAILEVLPKTGEGMLFTDLPDQVASTLNDQDRKNLGSVMWYTTVVKLELEVRGEIRRVPGATPQRLLRGPG